MKTLLLIIVIIFPALCIELPLPMNDRFFGIQLSTGDNGRTDSSFFLARRNGSTTVTLDIDWDQLEDSLGNYNDPYLQLYYANIMYHYYPTKLILILKSLDTDSNRVPKHLKQRPMNDSLVVAHYLGLLDFVMTNLPDISVHAIAIGNETDNYLKKHPLLWPEYKAFYKTVADSIHARYPGLLVANKNTWFGIKYYNRADIQELNQASDVIFANYYLLDSNIQVTSPMNLHTDFDTLCALFPGKPIYITEFGCPSSDSFINGSEEIQRQFIVEGFRAWDAHRDQIKCLYFFWLYDITQSTLDMFGQWYGNTAPWFMAWLGSLGLVSREGREKPAFVALREEIEARLEPPPPPLPSARSFYMGFTPWPYDNTLEAVNRTYDSILANGDLVSEHIEQGIPWTECYNNAPFPQAFTDDLAWKKSSLGTNNHKIFLSLTPLNLDRSGLALNRGVTENEPLPQEWTARSLNSDSVKQAFLNYSRWMIEFFNPTWVALGIESNLLIRNTPALWEPFVELRKSVYDSLKANYPALQIGTTLFSAPFYPEWSGADTLAVQLKALSDVSKSSDFIAFSIYPYMSALLCDSLPDDYVSTLFALTNKPVAISECGYSAQSWTANGNLFAGSPTKQNRFLSQALRACADRQALFAVWYTAFDFDSLWAHALGRDSLSLIWRDCGLLNDTGIPRNGWATWNHWLELPFVTVPEEKKSNPPLPHPSMIAIPNPCNPSTRIIVPVSNVQNRQLKIFNQQGKLIRTLKVERGVSSLSWDGKNSQNKPLASGVYLISIETSSKRQVLPILLLK